MTGAECPECGNPVGADDLTLGGCPIGRSDCDTCGYCYCDGGC